MLSIQLEILLSSEVGVQFEALIRQLVIEEKNRSVLRFCQLMVVFEKSSIHFFLRFIAILDLMLEALISLIFTRQFPSSRLMLFLLICQSTIMALSSCVLNQLLNIILTNCLQSLIRLLLLTSLTLLMEKVEGLTYRAMFISKPMETELIQEINSKQWNTTLRRRTQHYGYKYSYEKTNTLEKEQPIPLAFEPVKQQIEAYIHELTGKPCRFDQLIVNEYEPGQGISAHIDNKILFSDVIVSLSMGSNAVMVFQKGQQKHSLLLERCSLLVMRGEGRWQWKHSIPARKKDEGVPRSTRLSMTWRKVNEQAKDKSPVLMV